MDWPNEAWRFLDSEENREILTFVGAGIAAIVIAGWQLYTHFARSGSSEEASRTVTASGGGLASGETIAITQSLPGTLNVGGVHGVPPEDFQRVSAALGVTQAALASFFKVLEKQRVAPEDLDSTLRDFAKRFKQLEEDLKRYTSDDPEVAALREQARAALEAGEFDRAEQLLNEASAKDLAAAERQESVARQRRLSAAQSKANNGDLKWTQFAYREAAEYYRQAAALVPAEAEEQRAEYLNLQGRALHDGGDYRNAEGPLTQALALREKTLGPEHPDVAESLNNLAGLDDDQGQYAKAEPLYHRALAIAEKALGPEHPTVATIRRTTPHRCARRAARPRPTHSRRGRLRRRPSRVEVGASPAFRKIAQEAAPETPLVAVRWVLPIADKISVSEHRRVLYWIAHPLAPSRWEVE